jgi:hypothetical protein
MFTIASCIFSSYVNIGLQMIPLGNIFYYFTIVLLFIMNHSYELDNRGVGLRIPVRLKNFLQFIQTSSVVHSYPVSSGSSIYGDK